MGATIITYGKPPGRMSKKKRTDVVLKLNKGELHLPDAEWPPDSSIEEVDNGVTLNLNLKYHGKSFFIPSKSSRTLKKRGE